MSWRNIPALAAIVASSILLQDNVIAQQKILKDQLIGSWTLVSADTIFPDGRKAAFFGTNPKGLLVFDAGGRFIEVRVRPDRPRFRSSNRLEATPEENKAALAGGVAQFGTWSVSEADKAISLHMDGNVHFPNEEGTDQKRLI